jgi:hypothetical protein
MKVFIVIFQGEICDIFSTKEKAIDYVMNCDWIPRHLLSLRENYNNEISIADFAEQIIEEHSVN